MSACKDLTKLRTELDMLLHASTTGMSENVESEASSFVKQLTNYPEDIRDDREFLRLLVRGPNGVVELQRRISARICKRGDTGNDND